MLKIHQPTIQQLRLFDAVARLGSVTLAAKEVSLSQPTVSMQLKSLEEKLGLTLTEVHNRKIHLTRAGEEVARTAREVLQQLAQMERNLNDLHDNIAGPVSIAAVSSTKYFLPQMIGRFHRDYPKSRPQFSISNRQNLLKRMSERKDDIYIMGQLPDNFQMNVAPFQENIISLVASANHPLAREKNINLDDISRAQMIGREAGSGTRNAVEDLFAEAGLSLDYEMNFEDIEAIKQAVLSGLGIAYLSQQALRLELAAGELVVLEVEGFPIRKPWFAAIDKSRTHSKAVYKFLDFLASQDA